MKKILLFLSIVAVSTTWADNPFEFVEEEIVEPITQSPEINNPINRDVIGPNINDDLMRGTMPSNMQNNYTTDERALRGLNYNDIKMAVVNGITIFYNIKTDEYKYIDMSITYEELIKIQEMNFAGDQ